MSSTSKHQRCSRWLANTTLAARRLKSLKPHCVSRMAPPAHQARPVGTGQWVRGRACAGRWPGRAADGSSAHSAHCRPPVAGPRPPPAPPPQPAAIQGPAACQPACHPPATNMTSRWKPRVRKLRRKWRLAAADCSRCARLPTCSQAHQGRVSGQILPKWPAAAARAQAGQAAGGSAAVAAHRWGREAGRRTTMPSGPAGSAGSAAGSFTLPR
jgi:hypothetical protein